MSEPSRYHYLGQWWVPETRIRDLEAQNAALLADVNQDEGYERLKVRISELEADLAIVTKDRDSLLARIQTTVGVVADQLHTARSGMETQAVNPTHQHREFCGALRGMPCICDATPLETKGEQT
jgi:hypothetical protein